MSRSAALATLLVFSLSVPCEAAEDEKGTPSPSAVQTTEPKTSRAARANARLSQQEEARFKALVESGDRALAAGRLNDAADAYEGALNLKLDPRLLGRLGLVLSMFQQTPENDIVIARALHAAVSEAAGASSAERRQFFEAYERVRKRVCRLDVMTSDVNANVMIGGSNVGRSEGAFWTFVPPGKIDVVASLPERRDVKETVACVSGKPIFVELNFPPPPPREAPPRGTIVREPKEKPVVVREKVGPLSAPTGRGLFSVEGGPTLVAGALPSPALGASLAGWYRRETFSVTAGVRGAWSVGSVEDRPIDAFILSGVAGPCVSWRWLDTCVLASLNVIQYDMADPPPYLPDRESEVIPGVGIGIGARYKIAGPVSIRLFGDVSSMLRQTSISIQTPNSATPVWNGGRFLASAGVTFVISQ
ncbi:hypothetical protein [Polyangium sorediatum]|uniref:Tetratricopeptide repeat protein n=1 Tax=Polyangium sorediatum TaxID=889274 RepID=A0ABT6P7H6_9BACT|nr:hypothetical protein [Polyangium sorediatum]MDI1436570.1 hypothetical protein [Polyangium sorediatum]